jgi:type II restriction/modification system DNA methylase subunit YeeA
MTVTEFIAKWGKVQLTERSAAQQHFLDLCELFEHPKPAAADPTGESFTFEKGAAKQGGGKGWADVWKKRHFGWEYKGKHKDLTAAYNQLLKYREALENPPLLVVCDMDRLVIHTNFTATAPDVHDIPLAELGTPRNLEIGRHLFYQPDKLKPGLTSAAITTEAAGRLAAIAQGMRERGLDPFQVARFLDRVVFCLFAEDTGLLPEGLFRKIVEKAGGDPKRFGKLIGQLFGAMADGGDFGLEPIRHFNGDLFADSVVLDLTAWEIESVLSATRLDWCAVDPSIFGTLFERGMDPAKRSQLGAHYTSREDIEQLVEPVIMAPLRREWDGVRQAVDKVVGKSRTPRSREKASALLHEFHTRLQHIKVLDPACGSGNFLYVALQKLKDLEKEVSVFAEGCGLAGFLPLVGPWQLYGIETNPYAFDLAQTTVWIGWLQWTQANGYGVSKDPVLQRLDSFHCMDAVLDLSDPANPREPDWPAVDFIVGNPPFLGDKKMRGELGDKYVSALRKLYERRIPGQSDLCCYWFEKARAQIEKGACARAGLLATQGIRGGANRTALERIKRTGGIFCAWSDREWVLEGATVHVSMVGFDDGRETERTLDDSRVTVIESNLTAGTQGALHATDARPLSENGALCFLGVMKAGPFDVSEALALQWARLPNPHGRPNSDTLRPRLTARDILQRSEGGWIIDFGCYSSEADACLYEAPWQHITEHVKPVRVGNRRARLAQRWWIHGEPRPGLRATLQGLPRFIVTPEVSKHRIFSWLDGVYLADHQTRAFPRADDYFFGVLHSRIHELWARALGTQLRERESGFRYTPSSCFETFPLPSPTEEQSAAIALAARDLDQLRTNWLNPAEWVRKELLEFPGSASGPWARYVQDPDARGVGVVRYPRLVPNDEGCAKELAKRTLTNLYNQRPAWLQHAHQRLDAAGFAAYGWPATLTDDEILARLLDLNLRRAAAENQASSVPEPAPGDPEADNSER